jgi:hypothetical protein
MQTVAPTASPTRICEVLRPIYLAGEPVAVGTRHEMPVLLATELATALKVRIVPATELAAEADAAPAPVTATKGKAKAAPATE